MRYFREPEERDFGRNALTFSLGALGGIAAGLLLSNRGSRRAARLGDELRERARRATNMLRPERLQRRIGEQAELTDLEDAVIDALMADEVMSRRGIDVGAISRGIIELSGSVETEEEADDAVHLAGRVPGVETVVNRLDLEDELQSLRQTRSRVDAGGPERGHSGMGVGMGRRRQGRETDPDTANDSQKRRDSAIKEADRMQWIDEGYAAVNPHMSERPEVQRADRTDYEDDELSNQDPHGKHGTRTLDRQPQELNSSARVGQGLKPGTELRLEDSDVPLKPHSDGFETEGEDRDERES